MLGGPLCSEAGKSRELGPILAADLFQSPHLEICLLTAMLAQRIRSKKMGTGIKPSCSPQPTFLPLRGAFSSPRRVFQRGALAL